MLKAELMLHDFNKTIFSIETDVIFIISIKVFDII